MQFDNFLVVRSTVSFQTREMLGIKYVRHVRSLLSIQCCVCPSICWGIEKTLWRSSTPYRVVYGVLVQLVERLLCTQEVTGSTPVGSTPRKWILKNMCFAWSLLNSGLQTWELSSAGRASALQAECRRFESVSSHSKGNLGNKFNTIL